MDHKPQPATRVSPARLQEITELLDKTDRKIIRALDEWHYVSSSQIQRLFFTDKSLQANTRQRNRTLQQLVNYQLLSREPRHAIPGKTTKENVYSLAYPGQRFSSKYRTRPYRSLERAEAHYEHALAVTELYVRFREAEAARRIAEFEPLGEPACHIPLASGKILRPDASFTFKVDRGDKRGTARWFVEVERSQESKYKIVDKILKYIYYADRLESNAKTPRVLIVPMYRWLFRLLREIVDEYAGERRGMFEIVGYDQAIEMMITGVVNAS